MYERERKSYEEIALRSEETLYMEGYLKDNPTEIAELDISGQVVSDFVSNLLFSVDLSNTAYFPAIGKVLVGTTENS